jgi:hypothetical protein
MNSNMKMMLLAGVAALGLTAGSLRAADATAGSFTLPSQTNWGTGVLPAGDYTFRLNQASLDGRITVYKGTKSVLMVQSQGIGLIGSKEGSSMKIVNGRVRYLRLANIGVSYSFAPHKKEAQLFAARPAQPDTTVLVATR